MVFTDLLTEAWIRHQRAKTAAAHKHCVECYHHRSHGHWQTQGNVELLCQYLMNCSFEGSALFNHIAHFYESISGIICNISAGYCEIYLQSC